jgi:hypothetical protein
MRLVSSESRIDLYEDGVGVIKTYINMNLDTDVVKHRYRYVVSRSSSLYMKINEHENCDDRTAYILSRF